MLHIWLWVFRNAQESLLPLNVFCWSHIYPIHWTWRCHILAFQNINHLGLGNNFLAILHIIWVATVVTICSSEVFCTWIYLNLSICSMSYVMRDQRWDNHKITLKYLATMLSHVDRKQECPIFSPYIPAFCWYPVWVRF